MTRSHRRGRSWVTMMSNDEGCTVVIVGSGKTMLAAAMTALADVGTVGHIDHSAAVVERSERTMTLEVAESIAIRAFPTVLVEPRPDPSQNYLKLNKRRHRRGGKRNVR